MPARPESDNTGPYQLVPAHVPGERFAPGAILAGRYRLVTALGKGGMGEVWRADDLTLGQPVALKFLPRHLTADPDRLSRFRKEVAAARKVSHPNVCRVYDIGEHDGQPLLTMEFVDGEDLADLLKKVGRLPEERGVEIAQQLCSALAAVHEQGLLHRDLKPANVMLDGRGRVRLADFGLAAAEHEAADVRSGTPRYQAPEQLAGREVTPRSDLYALGLVLYELFSGKPAFAGRDRGTPPSRPSCQVTGLDPNVERIILRCLEPDPKDRPRSADELLAALEPYVRRLWPWRIVSWTRLLHGRVLDPMVGRNVLVGVLVGTALILVTIVCKLAAVHLLGNVHTPSYFLTAGEPYWFPLLSLGEAFSRTIRFVLLLFLLTVVLRREWLAALALFLLAEMEMHLSLAPGSMGSVAANLVIGGTLVLMILRGGMLPVMAASYSYLPADINIIADWSSWAFRFTAVVVPIVLGLAVYGFWVAKAGRPLLGKGFLDEG